MNYLDGKYNKKIFIFLGDYFLFLGDKKVDIIQRQLKNLYFKAVNSSQVEISKNFKRIKMFLLTETEY